VTAQWRQHPRRKKELTLEEFCGLDHLLISTSGGHFSGVVDNALAELGRERRVSVSIQSYARAPLVLACTDCLCTLPRRFSDALRTSIATTSRTAGFTLRLDTGLQRHWPPMTPASKHSRRKTAG
jgi:hypothetical protein